MAHADDGSRLLLPRPSQRSTLAVLLLHEAKPPTRWLLIDALWGEDPPTDADTALRVRMSDLRRALGDCGRLVTHQCGYQLLLRPGELDAAMFSNLASRGRDALDSSRPRDAARLLAQAAALWRDPPLADVPDTPLMRLVRTALMEQRRDVREWLIDARLALGQHHGVLADIRACITADPLAEHPHVQLMLALYRGGQKAAALAAYTRLRDLTVREFGQDPGPEARDLLEQMLADSPRLMPQPWTQPAHVAEGEPPAGCRAPAGWRRTGARPGRGPVRLCQSGAARHARLA